MCIGLPIVASDCPQISGVLKDRHDSLLVPNSDIASWVRVMEEIYRDSNLRDNLRRNVINSYSSHTWQSRAQTLFKFMNNTKHLGH